MRAGWAKQKGKFVVIARADNLQGAERLREKICKQCPEAEVQTTTVSAVIGAHTGLGMLAVICWGKAR